MSRAFFALAVTLGLGACAMPAVPPAPVSVAAIEAAEDALPAPLALGDFHLAAGLPPGTDRGVHIRGGIIVPQGGTFSGYLRDTLHDQLAAAGRYDDHAPLRLEGVITRSQGSSGVGDQSGHGVLAVHFSVRRGDVEVFARDYTAEHHWNSSFIGVVAFPEAERGYMSLYPEVITQLFRDPDLRAALRKAPGAPLG